MYKVVKKLNENTYEVFEEFTTFEEAENMARVLEIFLGYKGIFVEEV